MENFNKKIIKFFCLNKSICIQMLSIPDNCGVTFPKELSYFFELKETFLIKLDQI